VNAERARPENPLPPAIDVTVAAGAWPPAGELESLAGRSIGAAIAAGAAVPAGSEVSILFTDDAAIRALNARWRGKDMPTNVLSFPQGKGPLLGDIVLAAETVGNEAALAQKPLNDHIAHLIVHGFFHLLGHDHENPDEAERMEALERAALDTMGIDDPYRAPATDSWATN
jgi:probable rRNA maturation factor